MLFCKLCKSLKGKSRKYYEDDLIAVMHCVGCGRLLVAVKRHSVTPTDEEEESARSRLLIIGAVGEIDDSLKEYPHHWHLHLIRM